jgi:hypothetical protein
MGALCFTVLVHQYFRTMTSALVAPLDAFPSLRASVHQVDADLPVLEPAPLYDAIYADKQVLDVMSALFLAFGLGTVFLAVIGLFAFAISRALAATLDNVPAAGPGAFAIIVLTISAGAVLAMWTPVWRAARLSPLDALRDQ